jgi:hypothetical protein
MAPGGQVGFSSEYEVPVLDKSFSDNAELTGFLASEY